MVVKFWAFVASVASAYKRDIKPCWNIRLNNEQAFCYDAIEHSMSEPVFYSADGRDREAQRKYNELRDKWQASEGKLPSNDCLAIARDFFCYTEFPRCEDNDRQETGLCTHTC